MRRIATFFVLLMLPLSLLAAGGGMTRREGFLMIWEGIRREVDPYREQPFTDVPAGGTGSDILTYAKSRGILDDDEMFHPDEPFLLKDAVLWLLRTRNVEDLDAMTAQSLPSLLSRYPFLEQSRDLAAPVSSLDELIALAGALDQMLAKQVHEASLYAEKFQGKGTAFGESFDMNALTAAHRTYPANTLVKVTNVENGRSVIVRINDRGPYVAGRDMDLSLAAFTRIAPRGQGVLRARFERLGDAALVDACNGVLRRYQKRITRDVRFDRGIPHTSGIGVPLTLTARRPFVVRSVTYPDGSVERIEDWVLSGEIFSLTPSAPGTYVFKVGTADGRSRAMTMEAWECR